MFLRIFIPTVLVALTGAMSPGPMLALVISQAVAAGPWSVAWILLGHALLEAGIMLGIQRGFGEFLQRDRVRGVMSILGGLVLGWMGWATYAAAASASLHDSQATPLAPAALVVAGIGVSLSNPYFTGWWATVGSGSITALNVRSRAENFAFFAAHELGDILWYVFVAAALSLGRDRLSDSLYQVLLQGCGLVVMALGALFLGIGCRCAAKAHTRASATPLPQQNQSLPPTPNHSNPGETP